jgi:carboxypeptidase Taq
LFWSHSHGRRTLGVAPANDAEGCLQDGQWACGQIGYFPTYTLDNLFAAQLYATACADLGNLDDSFARGDFRGLPGWLRENVHRQGSRYPVARLIGRITGARPDHRPLIASLHRENGELYGLAA